VAISNLPDHCADLNSETTMSHKAQPAAESQVALHASDASGPRPAEKYLSIIVYSSRWMQAPLYLGLIVAQAVYVYIFFVQLIELLSGLRTLEDSDAMLIVLGLVDVVMISNLLIMVIIGGYEIFVTRIMLYSVHERPEWLAHANASTMKIKLALSLIGISSIHLLKSFINSENISQAALFWQVTIHTIFLVSALAMALTDKISRDQ
jgi:uncharacterized protein (TIGR00645 family)